MSVLRAEAVRLLNSTSENNLTAIIRFINYLNSISENNNMLSDEGLCANGSKVRLGLAKNRLKCPTDFHKDDEEIFQMFEGGL